MYDTICIDMYRHRAFTERGCLIGDSRIDPVANPYPRKDGIGVSIIYYVTNVIKKGWKARMKGYQINPFKTNIF